MVKFRNWFLENIIPDDIRHVLESFAMSYWELHPNDAYAFSDALEETGNQYLLSLAQLLRKRNNKDQIQELEFGSFKVNRILHTTLLIRDDLSLKELDKLPEPTAADYRNHEKADIMLIYPDGGYTAYGKSNEKWYKSMENWGKGNNVQPSSYRGRFSPMPPTPEQSYYVIPPNAWNQFNIAIPINIKKVPSEVLLCLICHAFSSHNDY